MAGYLESGNSRIMSKCFCSSRENTIRRLTQSSPSTVRTNCLPNEPVPPVTRMDFPASLSRISSRRKELRSVTVRVPLGMKS